MHRRSSRSAGGSGCPTPFVVNEEVDLRPFRGRGLATLEPITALLREIGEHYGKSPAQVALRWLIENDAVLPIPGAKNRSQATTNAGALTFHLTQDEMAALDAATRGKHLTPGG